MRDKKWLLNNLRRGEVDEKGFDKNIVLVGMPGAGKTYIGEKLAKLLVHFNYIDTDKKIEEQTELSIPEIFEKYSESYFRELESKLIQEISQNKSQIISIGGGAFERDENIEFLKQNGITFYLKSSIGELFDRIKEEEHRPLLAQNFSPKILEDMLKKREKNYLKSDFIIDTDKKQAYTILNDILGEYENYVRQRIGC